MEERIISTALRLIDGLLELREDLLAAAETGEFSDEQRARLRARLEDQQSRMARQEERAARIFGT